MSEDKLPSDQWQPALNLPMARWDEEEEYWFHKGEMNDEPLLIENTKPRKNENRSNKS